MSLVTLDSGATMTARLDELRIWFPSGTAEGERDILKKVFVYVQEFKNIISPPRGSPHLLIGKKGSGKSAIIDFSLKVLNNQSVPALLLVPAHINTSTLLESDSISELTRKTESLIVSAISRRLSERGRDFLVGDAATIYDEAVRSGETSPDFIGKLARVLAKSSKSATNVDLSSVFPDFTSHTTQEVKEAISHTLKDKSFYIFLDDTDQIASPDKSGHLNRIWGLILSLRSLTSTIPELRVIISLRTEVWDRLRTDNAGSRDQTDHFTNLCVRLNSDVKQIKSIIERRLTFAAAACGPDVGLYSGFFEGETAKAPFSNDKRSWIDLITVRSRQRPRDGIQLINKLSSYAKDAGCSLIKEEHFQQVMPEFSEDRANLFAQEVEKECPQGLEVLKTFALINYDQGGFRLTAQEARTHMSSMATRFSITLYGSVLRAGNEEDMFRLWRFMYISGILNARVSDDTQTEGYRHVDSDKEPNLVSPSRWNIMQKMLWEINPAYRDFLFVIKRQDRAMTGLPVRRPRRTRR